MQYIIRKIHLVHRNILLHCGSYQSKYVRLVLRKKSCALKRQNINEIKETDIQFSNSILGWTLTNIVYAVADERLTKGNNGGNVQSQ